MHGRALHFLPCYSTTTTLMISLSLTALSHAIKHCQSGNRPSCRIIQPLTGERLAHLTSNTEDGARLDVRAQGFWGDRHQSAFFDVRVFNPLAPSNCRSSLTSTYRQHEGLKRRAYEQRVREIEMGSFTPLVFSATGGMAPAATIMYKRLASLLAEKRHQTYSKTISWLRCSIGFSLVRSAVMCLRGSRSSFHHPTSDVHMDVAISESRVPMI